MGINPTVEPGVLTDHDRFIFECFGYFLIEDILTEDECQEVIEASKRIHKDNTSTTQEQIGRGFETEPAIENLIDHPAVIPKIRGLLGDKFVLQSAWCTQKPAGDTRVFWHQDGSSAYDFKELGYPVPLLQLRATYLLTDQSEPNMGNMVMIPGSHRSRLPLEKDRFQKVDASPIQHIICGKPGTVQIFHNGVWHSPMPNLQDIDRYNMHYIYSPPWVRRSDRDNTDPAFLERTTEVRRAMMGDYDRPDRPFGAGGYPPIPFDD